MPPPPQILLVDDNAGVRKATTLLLSASGYRVLPAGSLEEARRLIAENPKLALLITDYHLLNGETGIDVLLAARAALGQQLPALLVTGDVSENVRGLPADDGIRLVSKPINVSEFLALLRQLIQTV